MTTASTRHACILGTGSYLPANRVTNSALAERLARDVGMLGDAGEFLGNLHGRKNQIDTARGHCAARHRGVHG